MPSEKELLEQLVNLVSRELEGQGAELEDLRERFHEIDKLLAVQIAKASTISALAAGLISIGVSFLTK